jgi:hypothetical protein
VSRRNRDIPIEPAPQRLRMAVLRGATSAHSNMKRVDVMPEDLGRDTLNRRHFMATAIGASAALAANPEAASAQPATSSRGTAYTGDMIDGKKVISALDIDDLESGKKHLFYFQGVQEAHGSTLAKLGARHRPD